MLRDVESERAIVSRPLISISRARSSVRSALPRIEPMAFWKILLSCGWSESLRSRARRRDCLAASMSLVASRPAALRATSDSAMGRGLEKRFCQGALTLAKPERRAMKDMPMTPTRERHASLRVCDLGSWDGALVDVLPSSCPPAHQKPMTQRDVLINCSTHAARNLPLLLLENSHPAADMTDWISSEGMTTTRRSNKSGTVKWKAKRRANGLIVFEISQRINSARTAARAIVAEEVIAAALRVVKCEGERLNELSRFGFDEVSPARIGKIF